MFETVHNDELMIPIELKIVVLFAIKVLHKFETFTQQAFEYPLVVVSVYKVGITVLFCVFSIFFTSCTAVRYR